MKLKSHVAEPLVPYIAPPSPVSRLIYAVNSTRLAMVRSRGMNADQMIAENKAMYQEVKHYFPFLDVRTMTAKEIRMTLYREIRSFTDAGWGR